MKQSEKQSDSVLPIIDVPMEYAMQYPNETCLLVRNEISGAWEEVKWSAFGRLVRETANAILHQGIEEGDRIAVFSENSPFFLATYLASFMAGSIAIPLYASSSAAQVRSILEHSDTRLIFVGEEAQYCAALDAIGEMSNPPQLVMYDRKIERRGEDRSSLYMDDFLRVAEESDYEEALKLRRSRWEVEQTALILYTSGTSGTSKGVEISYKNIQKAVNQHILELEHLKAGKISMNFLPLTHIFESMWCLVCLTMRIKIAVNSNPKRILQSLAEVRPHYMCNVPRFWEKVYVGVYEKIQGFSPLLKRITEECIRVSRMYHFEYWAKGKTPPWHLKMQYRFYSRTLLKMVKQKVGIERGLIFPVAGAALADKVHAFLLSIGVPIIYGYGLTETTATVSYCHPKGFEFGSIGRPLGGVEVKIDDKGEGEILVRGDNVTKGYYKAPEENAKSFTADGWFRTGDLGSMDIEGNIFFKERAKDLFKTANGKYIAPNVIENLLTSDVMIDQAVVIADGRSFVSALIHPDWGKVREVLLQQGETTLPDDVKVLAKSEAVYRLLEQRIADQLRELASFEKVKKFHILTEPLSIDNGMLTNSLKTKRMVVERYYEEAIKELYSYHRLPDLTK
ncbi:MAG: long-chain fatty acid--CoA ligase [Porphyromonas sp.]|nr:long-chain fatty acid--CoA ligase [Porphyromonas sp.]